MEAGMYDPNVVNGKNPPIGKHIEDTMSYRVSKLLNQFKDHGFEVRRGKFGEFHVSNGKHKFTLHRRNHGLCHKNEDGTLTPVTENCVSKLCKEHSGN